MTGAVSRFVTITIDTADMARRGRIGAYSKWAREPDRSAATSAARTAAMARFERQVDPDRLLSPDERATRATFARKAFMASIARKSALRRARKTTRTISAAPEASA